MEQKTLILLNNSYLMQSFITAGSQNHVQGKFLSRKLAENEEKHNQSLLKFTVVQLKDKVIFIL